MSDDLKYQLRLTLKDGYAQTARANPGDASIAPLTSILSRHDAALKCQFDAFAGYVSEAEANGVDKYPLYEWTKATVDDPPRRRNIIRSFSIYVGGREVYEKHEADALEAELKPLVGGPIVAKMFKYDSDPANNPQPPPQQALSGLGRDRGTPHPSLEAFSRSIGIRSRARLCRLDRLGRATRPSCRSRAAFLSFELGCDDRLELSEEAFAGDLRGVIALLAQLLPDLVDRSAFA